MKICFVQNRISAGGIGKVATTYGNALVEEFDADISFVLLHKLPKFYYTHPNVKLFDNPNSRESLGKIGYTIKSVGFLREHFKIHDYDVVIVSGEWITSYFYFATLGQKLNILFWDHSNPIRPSQSPVKVLDRISYKFVGGVLTLSTKASMKISQLHKQRNVYQIENPIKMLGKSTVNRKKIIITMGRLSHEKGIEVLINAFHKLGPTDWRLQILGDGYMRESLEELVEQLGISESVDFLGQQQNIVQFLHQASIYVMPSLTENFPMAMLEAMSTGLPVIASDCMKWRGDEDFIQHQLTGIKVKVGDETELSKAILGLMENETYRMQLGNTGFEYLIEKFEIKDQVKSFYKVLERSISNNSTRENK